MKIDRKQILFSFLETIDSISDKEYQLRVWIRGDGPECDDYDETISFFFLEGVAIIENYEKFHITDAQHQLLAKLREALHEFNNDENHYWPPDFIDSPEWAKIMKMAKEVLVAFNYKK